MFSGKARARSVSVARTTVLWVLALAFLLGIQPASAGSITGDVCMQTLFGGNLVCTANDVSISRAIPGSAVPTSCEEDEVFDLTATFEVVTTATKRYDIGLTFDVGGDPEGDGARTGECSLSTLATAPVPPNENYDNDFCGDTSSAKSPRQVTVTFNDIKCSDPDGDGKLNLPYCTSWVNNSGVVCSEEEEAIPETKSKCKCDLNFEIPVTVVPPGSIDVVKTAGSPPTEPGGEVEFTLTVTNTSDVSVTLTTIVDDPDNDPLTDDSVEYDASVICDATVLAPQGEAGDETTCTFTTTIEGDAGESFTDKACVEGTDEKETEISGCDDETVTIEDAEPMATVAKAALSTVCATVRYNVTVTNTSAAEDVTLDKLCDSAFGTIVGDGCDDGTTGPIDTTTCAVPQTITAGGDYSCTFDAEVCTAGHENQVTATVSDDDGNSTTPSGSETLGDAPPDFDE